MFEYLKGVVVDKKLEYIVIDINGIGYKIYISLKSYEKITLLEEGKVYIHNYIREDTNKLIGFTSEKERNLFEILLNVNGIGVSLALAILSTFNVEELKGIILREDSKTLVKVPKLGPKKAQKLIVDVKDKVKTLHIEEDLSDSGRGGQNIYIIKEELYMALEALGYGKKEIDKLVVTKELEELESVEDAIKHVLKKIQGR